MAEIKKISTELQLLDKFLDTSGDAGTSGQVLTSTGTGINWVSGGSLPGGPYLPLSAGSTKPLTGHLYIAGIIRNSSGDLEIRNQTASGFATATKLKQQTVNGLETFLTLDGTSRNAYFTNQGNVGIGTTSPTQKLDVDGAIITEDYRAASIFYLTSGGDWRFRTDTGAERVRITSAGNVGIGTTSPGARLDVVGKINQAVSSGANSASFTNSDATSGYGVAIQSEGTSNTRYALILRNLDGSNVYGGVSTMTNQVGFWGIGASPTGTLGSRLTVGGNASIGSGYTANSAPTNGLIVEGNVGIGETSPDGKLHVHQTGSGTLTTIITEDDARKLFIGRDAINCKDLNNNNAVLFLNQAGGNVSVPNSSLGIGTTSPSQKLDVSGYSRATNGFVGSTSLKLFGDNSSTEYLGVNTNGTVQLTAYGAGTLVSDASGNITVSSGGGAGGPYLPLAGGTMTGATLHGDNVMSRYGTGNDFSIYHNGTDGYLQNEVGDLIITAGNVGIGTTSPGAKLEVAGGADAIARVLGTTTAARLDLQTNSYHKFIQIIESDGRFRLYNQTTSLEQLTVLNGGNVGIGTTSPDYKFEVQGVISSADAGLQKATFANVGNDLVLTANADATNVTAKMLFNSSGAGGTSVSTKMIIDGNGNVGIGTVSPGSKLQVSGSGNESVEIKVSGGTTAGNTGSISLSRTDGAGSIIQGAAFLSGGVPIGGIAGGIVGSSNTSAPAFAIQTPNSTNGHIVFNPKGTEKMRITSGGNVGIGVTGPTSKLTIETDAGDGTIELLAVNAATTKNKIIFSEAVLGDESFFIEHDGAGAGADNLLKIHGDGSGGTASGVTIRRNGLVGIGTNSPTTRLHLADSNTVLTIESTTNGQNCSTWYKANGNNQWETGCNIGAGTDYQIYDRLNSASRMVVGHNGNVTIPGKVGIGTTSPSTPLMVNRALNSTLPTLYLDTQGGSGGSVGLGQNTTIGPYLVGNTLPNNDVRGAYPASRMLFNGGGFSFQTSDETSGARTFDDKMKILINGNVGIGATSPGKKLEVVSNTTYDGIQIKGSSIPTLGIIDTTNNAKFVAYVRDSDATIGMETNHPLTIDTNNTERVRVTATGNVGIGTTSPGAKLDVAGSINTSGSINLTNAGVNTIAASNASNGYLRFLVDQQGVALTLNADLTSTFGGEIYTVDGNKAAPSYSFTSDPDTGMMSDAANHLKFVTGSDIRMVITSTGALAFGSSTNYGTSGQVLTSNGNAAPSWQSGGGGASSLNGLSDCLVNTTNSSFNIGNNASGMTGIRNTTIGSSAGTSITTGSTNICIGPDAGNSIANGSQNIAIGYLSQGGNTFNSGNVSIGYLSQQGSNGGNNVSIGNYSLRGTQSTGNRNGIVAIGYQAAQSLGNLSSNSIIIGFTAQASATTASNEITLGNSSITSLRCAVTSITSLSDERDKSEIKDLEYGLDFISSLKPRQFVWDNRIETRTDIDNEGNETEVEFYSANKGKKDFGFIAQEVKELDNDTLRLVYDNNPEKLELSYGKLVPVLVKAIQELKAEIELLKQK